LEPGIGARSRGERLRATRHGRECTIYAGCKGQDAWRARQEKRPLPPMIQELRRVGRVNGHRSINVDVSAQPLSEVIKSDCHLGVAAG
ncbi:MAG TPA: hypothetical protein VHG30_01080, partial [Microvirga sp.]|nr:hypothetical protein [Microvirga sp.]